MREVKINDGRLETENKGSILCPAIASFLCNTNCAWYHEETGVAQGIDAKMVAMCGGKVIGIIEGD